ncbi:DUF1002 domain-containing protein [Blautia sp.]|uniref:DUF1002 domain-containing protein n=1 Tax=Blautia sp. TaxID=1955243 RepID=UPI002615302A|nr:DUF1002 domain-containing protein [uncultured Blautia sp.]
MKKRSMIVAALCSMCLALSNPIPAMADASKVVTLGADLTDEQKNTMMKYFKADASQVQIITVNNQDERNYLGKYISSAQIGTRTLSCAYVKPTQSGGIKVRTANLNYVTCNMLANALSTAGVSNCEAVAACPYEVSGTGALTGVMMAYETASGKQLDSTKKDLATKEVVVTGDVAQQVGGDNATNIINQAKLQIIGDNVQNADEIYNIVNNIAIQNNVSLSSDELNTITALLQEIVQQNYDIQEMKQTLESIQKNLDKTMNNDSSSDDSSSDDSSSDGEEDLVDEDSSDGEDITEDVDSDVLDGAKESYTEDASVAEDTGMNDVLEPDDGSEDDGMGIPEATEDGTQDNYEEITETPEGTDSTDTSTDESDSSSDDGTGIPEATGDETYETDASTEDTLNTDSLDDASKAQFDQAEQFCEGEYNGDIAVLNTVMPNAVQPTVTLDTDTASKLTKKVLEAYLKVLKDGGATYTASETDSYVSSQLNMVNNDMKKIFSIETEPATDDILAAQSAEDRQTLYNDTMKFFEQLYGESTDTSAQQESTDETSYDEESYDEESYNEEY